MSDDFRLQYDERIIALQGAATAVPPALLKLACCTEAELLSPDANSIKSILTYLAATKKAEYLQTLFTDCLIFGVGEDADCIFFPYPWLQGMRKLASLFSPGEVTHWRISSLNGGRHMLLNHKDSNIRKMHDEMKTLGIVMAPGKSVEQYDGVPKGFSKEDRTRFVRILDQLAAS